MEEEGGDLVIWFSNCRCGRVRKPWSPSCAFFTMLPFSLIVYNDSKPMLYILDRERMGLPHEVIVTHETHRIMA